MSILSKTRHYLVRAAGINLVHHEVINTKKLAQINLALNKGLLAKSRVIKENDPDTWEFSGFSQNGEDGIIEFLSGKIKEPNQYFVEMGASNGIQNNSSWLAIVNKWKGLMIDGSEKLVKECTELMATHAPKVDVRQYFISLDNIDEIQSRFLTNEPDVFSLDIDGNDYHIMHQLLSKNFTPAIIVVEYNSALGPDQRLTIRYDKNFRYQYPLNYGCAIAAWKNLFSSFGYRFVTVDKEGVNAFFIHPLLVDSSFIDNNFKSIPFSENSHQFKNYGKGWEHQNTFIKKELFEEVG